MLALYGFENGGLFLSKIVCWLACAIGVLPIRIVRNKGVNVVRCIWQETNSLV